MSNIRASTQQHLEIADIRDNLVFLKNGSVSLILQTTAVNFGLLSEGEQDVIIYAYAALLNSLNFPIQVVIRSKRSDVSAYLKLLSEHEAKQTNPDLKKQISQYREFVSATVQKNQVLDKSFYLVITLTALELGIKGAAASLKKQKGPVYPIEYLLEHAKTNLYPKRDHLIKQLTRLGLRSRELASQELVELYYDIYNPTEVGSQKVDTEISSYTAPLVAPAIEGAEINKSPTQTPTFNFPPNTPKPAQTETPKTTFPISEKIIGQTPPTVSVNPLQPTLSPTQNNQQEALKSLQDAISKANQLLKDQKDKNPKTENSTQIQK